MDRLTRTDLRMALRQRLLELEQSPPPGSGDRGRAAAFCHRPAHGAHHAPRRALGDLPGSRRRRNPHPPGRRLLEPASAITASTDAIAESEAGRERRKKGEVSAGALCPGRPPFLPAQWVAFDDQGQLVGWGNEAEAHIGSMQRYLSVLHAAVSLAPYMVADEEYQHKRYGILGQLVNQGRALALYETEEIIRTIQRRASAHD